MTIERPASVARPLPSATIALARDGDDAPELLLVLRHAKAAFGSTYVFPGGMLCADDYAVEPRCSGLDDATASANLCLAAGGLAYYSAALRELFEEAGVLLARPTDGAWADADSLARYREPLNAGRTSWLEFLERFELQLACDALHYFAFWITPREVKKRFTTRFFIAPAPEGQEATHCGAELTDSRWMSASAALADHEAGAIELPFPTVMTLERLRGFSTTAALLDWADRQSSEGVACQQPAIVFVDGEKRFVLPGDPDYPEYTETGEPR